MTVILFLSLHITSDLQQKYFRAIIKGIKASNELILMKIF